MDAAGCDCRACGENVPHQPPDENMIARALAAHPPVFRPVKRRLAFYDSRRLTVVSRAAPADQPWVPRAPRKRAA